MRIYIAGPYCPKSDDVHSHAREAQFNVDMAISAFHLLKKEGHQPFVPHLSHYIHINPYADDYGAFWYAYDLTFLDHWAEAICMVGDWKNSKGAMLELERARELGLKAYYIEGDAPDRLLVMYELEDEPMRKPGEIKISETIQSCTTFRMADPKYHTDSR